MRADYYVYFYRNTINGRWYVGKGTRDRIYQHMLTSRSGLLGKAIQKHGRESFLRGKIHTNLTQSQALALETSWIAILGAKGPGGYNLTTGGDGCRGYKHSDETKERRAAHFRGKPRTEEVKAKLRAANLGKKHAGEIKEKMRAAKSPKMRDWWASEAGLALKAARRLKAEEKRATGHK